MHIPTSAGATQNSKRLVKSKYIYALIDSKEMSCYTHLSTDQTYFSRSCVGSQHKLKLHIGIGNQQVVIGYWFLDTTLPYCSSAYRIPSYRKNKTSDSVQSTRGGKKKKKR